LDLTPEPHELSILLADLQEERVLALVRERLARGEDPLLLLEDCQKGMRIVGQRYEKEIYFVSGLIIAGEIMREIGKIVLPLLASNIDQRESGSVLLGTVQGDIHFIGKDIFKVLARCHGFKVHDLGVDVAPGAFVEAVQKTSPQIIGLSCLLSPCFQTMKSIISRIREQARFSGPAPSFIIGGMVDERVCEHVGADHWATDAMVGVHRCQEIMRERSTAGSKSL
jgi:methanogenic corrinoid protein MtbC1